jgi:two-component system cell cycle response regulator DivK
MGRLIAPAAGPILVVEDNALSCRLLRHVLEHDGRPTASAGSIAEAELTIATQAPILMILDLRLPDGDGLDLARRLKRDPCSSGLPILATSAGIAGGERERALRAGCDAYVGKPIEISSFVRTVSSLLSEDRGRAPALL